MARVIDITERLGLNDGNDKPAVIINGESYEVSDKAQTVLVVMQIVGSGNDVTPDDAVKAANALFGEDNTKKLLETLTFNQFVETLSAATEVAAGGDEEGDEGNAVTPATT